MAKKTGHPASSAKLPSGQEDTGFRETKSDIAVDEDEISVKSDFNNEEDSVSSFHASEEGDVESEDAELELELMEEVEEEEEEDDEDDVPSRKRQKTRRKSSRQASESESEEIDMEEVDLAAAASSFPEMQEMMVQSATNKTENEPILIPSMALGDMISAYVTIRAFSWQIRLSPFSFESFCSAMMSNEPSQIMDELHLSVLRALAVDEVRSERNERELSLEYLDFMTWPCYILEWLRLKGYAIKYVSAGDEDSDEEHSEESENDKNEADANKEDGKSHATPMDMDEELIVEEEVVETTNASAQETDNDPTGKSENGQKNEQPVGMGIKALLTRSEEKNNESRSRIERPEYNALSIEIKASILRILCDSLIERPSVRAEIDRREATGQLYAGKGGEGGAFPIMSTKEREKATAKALKMKQTDVNTEKCVLCGLGGVLMCCDGCPAAYHMRCTGENGRVLESKDWKCPECLAGGRGESAGLRLAIARIKPPRDPIYLFNGIVIRCKGPKVISRGSGAMEMMDAFQVQLYFGEDGCVILDESRSIKRCQLISSSYNSLKDFPEWPNDLPSTLEGYVNKYKHGWAAATAAMRSHVEDTRKRKSRDKFWIPNGTCSRVYVAELPVPMSISRYQWFQMNARALGRTTIRCGTCHTCLRPSLRKGCLKPIVKSSESDEGSENSKMGYLIALLAKMEKEFWPLAEGPWSSADGGHIFRNQWIASLRSCSSVRRFKHLLLQLEASLRTICFLPDWYKNFPEELCNRNTQDNHNVDRSLTEAMLKSDSAAPLEEGRSHHVYDIDSDPSIASLVKSHGEWSTRNYKRTQPIGKFGPPKFLVRKAILQAGRKPILGLTYRNKKWKINNKRLLWIAEVESSQNCAELAIALRKLDSVLRWDSISKPKHIAHTMYSNATLQAKQSNLDGTHEYVLNLLPEKDEDDVLVNEPPVTQEIKSHENQVKANTGFENTESDEKMSKRCGQCSTCKNPSSKKACLTLVALREAEQVHNQFSKIFEDVKSPKSSGDATQTKILAPSVKHETDSACDATAEAKVWTNESKLPLWLVRSYEENIRREAARSAMKANNFLRKQSKQEIAPTPGTDISEKRKMEEAIAGDDEGHVCSLCFNSIASHSKSRFIECKKCARCFHGYCVILTNQEIDSMDPKEEWHCPGCYGSRKLIARLEKEPKAGQQLPGVEVVEEPPKKDKKHRGRPTKPFFERADYKLAERKEIMKRLGQAEHPELFDILNDEEQEKSDQSDSSNEKLMPYDEMGEEIFSENKTSCPVCQYPDLGRPLYTCVNCSRQFHKECLGIILDNPRLLDPNRVKCAECSGKRVRPPSENVILSAIEAAQEPTSELASIEDRVKQRSKRIKAQKEVESAQLASKANWMDSAEKVLMRVFRMHVSEPFRFPVPLDILTDYTNYVDEPMDLDTIRNELYSYQSPLDVVQRIDMIVSNCIAYNGEDSKYSDGVKHMRSSFSRLWKKEGLPLTDQDTMSEALMEKCNPSVDVVPPQVASHLLVGEPSSDWQRKAGKVLSQISRLEHTEPFLRPVPKDFMNYYEVIRRPMDLGAMKSKLADGRYIDPSQLIADMELIWSNCLKFNQPDAPIIDDCEKTKEAFEKAWIAAKVMIPDATGGAKVEERAVTRTDDWVEQARGVLYRLINFVPQASWFYDPVDEEDAPGYKDVVKTPMDLQTISEKLQSGKYAAPGNLLADMELITKNAEAYNGTDDEITEGAHAVATAFKKYWVNAGLGSANVAFVSPDDWISKATSTIETVLAHPSSEPFAQPVSERTAPGYSRLIKRPMDFSTILFNLQRNSYGSPGQVIDDVAQIFQNCRIYNPPGDEIRAMGSETESIFRKTWESMGLPVPRKWKKR